jgi:hypothetical protein
VRQTVATVAIQKVGARKAFEVLRFVTGWALCWEELGHRPTMPEYVRWAGVLGVSSKTCYRDAQMFREAFDKCDDPSPLVRAARGRISKAGSLAGSTAVVAGLSIR